MSQLLEVADSPPVTVTPQTTVLEAVEEMDRKKVGAVCVLQDSKLVGIFSERDVMLRVVLRRLDPAKTTVSQVMTQNVLTIEAQITTDQALELMLERHIRHLPIRGKGEAILGMISIRNLLQGQVESLANQLDSLESYISADGSGG